MTEQEKSGSPEFMYLPLKSIIVEEQIRSGIDTEGESFKTLMESIKDRGILEPVLVTPKDGKYLLPYGERRYQAAQKLELASIPALTVNMITQKDEILAYQLTENLQREDFNPMDQAKGILAYIQAKLPDKGYTVDSFMSDLVSYKRRPEDLSDQVAPTVGAMVEITGKSMSTLFIYRQLLFDEVKCDNE
ncbi:MAG: ParB/RepB/Spo0J family partition protein [Proteobacteria bacterium]|nr:ParB/RepB/Spo0J family partition protein [Pseudomonadota bacterium]